MNEPTTPTPADEGDDDELLERIDALGTELTELQTWRKTASESIAALEALAKELQTSHERVAGDLQALTARLLELQKRTPSAKVI